MAIVAKVKNTQNLNPVVRTQQKSTIVSPNFAPKPNVALSELSDVSISGLEDGQVISFNSTTNKFENKLLDATNIDINRIVGGIF